MQYEPSCILMCSQKIKNDSFRRIYYLTNAQHLRFSLTVQHSHAIFWVKLVVAFISNLQGVGFFIYFCLYFPVGFENSIRVGKIILLLKRTWYFVNILFSSFHFKYSSFSQGRWYLPTSSQVDQITNKMSNNGGTYLTFFIQA